MRTAFTGGSVVLVLFPPVFPGPYIGAEILAGDLVKGPDPGDHLNAPYLHVQRDSFKVGFDNGISNLDK